MRGVLGVLGIIVVGLQLSPGASAQIGSGADVQVNTYTAGDQQTAAIAVGSDGKYLIVWQSDGSPGSDGDGRSVQARLYSAAGVPFGSQFQVNSFTTGSQYEPGVTTDTAGNFVVVWSSNDGQDPETVSVRGQRLA